jgi:hypothetical protein
MPKLALSIIFLTFLLLFGCAESGQAGPSYPAPASQPDRPGNGGTNGGMT